MIYYKINSQIYNNPESIKNEYPLYYSNIKALYRILKKEVATTLKFYPDIDIYISTKNVKNILGRFTTKATSEYKRKLNPNPYIVLYWNKIENYYTFHSVKGLKAVLYHEFLHYRQWYLGKKLKHRRGDGLPCHAKNAKLVNSELKISLNRLGRGL